VSQFNKAVLHKINSTTFEEAQTILIKDMLKFYMYAFKCGLLCGLVVRVPGYRSRDPGSIPGATRFSEKQWVWNGVHSAS
jgi:hypothetical protein